MNIKKIGKLLVTGILAGALAVTAGCGSKDKSANQAGDGDKKVITVAHTNYYVPYDFVNEKGESDGFEVAVMKEVAKKLPQYDFKFVPTSDDDSLIGVESGKYTEAPRVFGLQSLGRKSIFSRRIILVPV